MTKDRKILRCAQNCSVKQMCRWHTRGPHKAIWLCGERSRIEVSEFSRLRGNEGYGDCGDEA